MIPPTWQPVHRESDHELVGHLDRDGKGAGHAGYSPENRSTAAPRRYGPMD